MTAPATDQFEDDLFITSEEHGEGALRVLRRGLAETPEARAGLIATFFMGLSIAVGKLVVPIVILAMLTLAIGLMPQPLLAVADRAASELLDLDTFRATLGLLGSGR